MRKILSREVLPVLWPCIGLPKSTTVSGSWRVLAEVSIQAEYLGHCSSEPLQASLHQAAYRAKQMSHFVSAGAGDVENHQDILSSVFLSGGPL